MAYNLVVGYTIYNICKYYYYFLINSISLDVEKAPAELNPEERGGVLNV